MGNNRSFDLGDRVRWSSSSNGATLEKLGTIIEVVPPNGCPGRLGHAVWKSNRDHESYVVEAVINPRYSERSLQSAASLKRPKRYWPQTSKLTRVRKAK